MANVKYLMTVDSETGEPTRLQLVGDAGELTDVDLSELSCDGGGKAGGGTTIVVNIYADGVVDRHAEVRPVRPPVPHIRVPHPRHSPRPERPATSAEDILP
jgi:hypothetical protein